jgi:membrane protease YdiL (CAAX protease family)
MAFFLLTFGISWGVPGALFAIAAASHAFTVSLQPPSPLSYLVIWAPALATVSVIARSCGRAGLRAFGQRVLRWRANWRWSLGVLLGVPLATLLGGILTELAGIPWLQSPHAAVLSFLSAAVVVGTGGPMEELGWRGFALPLLQQRFSGLTAALILGFFWALWHVPAFFVESIMTGAMHGNVLQVQAQHFLGLAAKSVIITAIFNATDGSIPLAVAVHWLSNLAYPWEARAGIAPGQLVVEATIAMLLLITCRQRYLGRSGLWTRVVEGNICPSLQVSTQGHR